MPTYNQEEVTLWLKNMSTGALDLNADNIDLAASALTMISAPVPAPEPKPDLPPGYLSPNFTLAEMIASQTAQQKGIDNTPTDAAKIQLSELCNKTLEGVRTICGSRPVLISSGYRCPALNAAVGGVSNSAHLYGCAADLTIPAFGTVIDVCRFLIPHIVELEIDQLINEYGSGGSNWVHIGRAVPPSTPRYEIWTSKNGTYTKGI